MKCPFLKQHLYTCQHCRILFLLTPPSVILPQDWLAEFMQTEFIKKNAPWISIGVTGLHSVMLLNCTIWLQSCSYKKCNLLFTKGPNPNMKVYVSQFMLYTVTDNLVSTVCIWLHDHLVRINTQRHTDACAGDPHWPASLWFRTWCGQPL